MTGPLGAGARQLYTLARFLSPKVQATLKEIPELNVTDVSISKNRVLTMSLQHLHDGRETKTDQLTFSSEKVDGRYKLTFSGGIRCTEGTVVVHETQEVEEGKLREAMVELEQQTEALRKKMLEDEAKAIEHKYDSVGTSDLSLQLTRSYPVLEFYEGILAEKGRASPSPSDSSIEVDGGAASSSVASASASAPPDDEGDEKLKFEPTE